MKTILCLISFLTLAAWQPLSAQCGSAVPIVSAYYSYDPSTTFGAGIEGGYQGVDAPWALFAGVQVRALKTQEEMIPEDGLRTSVYLKGTFRVTGQHGAGSVFLVAAPAMDFSSGVRLQTGLRIMFPLGGKLGIGAEPLYSIREGRASLNLMFAF